MVDNNCEISTSFDGRSANALTSSGETFFPSTTPQITLGFFAAPDFAYSANAFAGATASSKLTTRDTGPINSSSNNSKGVFLGTKAVIPAMRAGGGGSSVNISSIAGIVGLTSSASYSASKGAVRLLTKSTAVQYGPERIRCNSVHPGFIDTEMNRAWLEDEEIRAERLKMTPLNMFANSHDVALAVLYLSSDESRYVTGAELVIDGGIIAK